MKYGRRGALETGGKGGNSVPNVDQTITEVVVGDAREYLGTPEGVNVKTGWTKKTYQTGKANDA